MIAPRTKLAQTVQTRSTACLALLGALVALTPGCAVVTHGLHQKVDIASAPAGATVLVDGAEAGRTPLTVNLARAKSHRVELRKPGFAPAVATLVPRLTEYSNRFLRWGIDIDSGAASELSPASLHLELVPEMLATPPAAGGDEFAQMSAAVLAADELKRTGAISDADHRFIIGKILARYAR
jgi:hypothetical protein